MQPPLARSGASTQGCGIRALNGWRQQQASAAPRLLPSCQRLVYARLHYTHCNAASLPSASHPRAVSGSSLSQPRPISTSSSSSSSSSRSSSRSSSSSSSLDDYTLLAAPASLLPAVKAFYKSQGQRGVGPKPGESLYVLVANRTEDIAVAVCVGAPRPGSIGSSGSGSGGSFRFLRALCVARPLRRLGLGRRMAAAVLDLHGDCSIYCFAFSELGDLYRQAGYEEVPPGAAPGWMEQQFTKVCSLDPHCQ